MLIASHLICYKKYDNEFICIKIIKIQLYKYNETKK